MALLAMEFVLDRSHVGAIRLLRVTIGTLEFHEFAIGAKEMRGIEMHTMIEFQPAGIEPFATISAGVLRSKTRHLSSGMARTDLFVSRSQQSEFRMTAGTGRELPDFRHKTHGRLAVQREATVARGALGVGQLRE